MPTTTTGLATSFITFSRPGASGGGATVTLSNGRIGWAGHNLLTNSESFDASAWVKNGTTTVAANVSTSPDGATTADKMAEVANTNAHGIDGPTTSFTAGAVYTFSVFVKAGSVGVVQLILGATAFGFDAYANFNASTGVVGALGSSATSSITAIGSGWYLCSITSTASSTTTTTAGIYLTNNNANAARAPSYAGSASSDILLWGAHLYRSDLGGMQQNPAMGAGMGSYYSTTPRNLLGYTEDFSTGWTRTNVLAFGSGSISNAAVAPNGLQTADKIVPTTAANDRHSIYQIIALGSGVNVISVYAKAGEYSLLRLADQSNGTFYASYDLAAGSVVSGSTGGTKYTSSAIASAGNGWYRCSMVVTNVAASTAIAFGGYPSGATLDNFGGTFTGDGVSGIYLWGAQLSDSASLDTYVPQYGAAVTSAAYYAPRLDFDPVTLSPKGLLVEEQRTNALLHSSDFSQAAWVPQNWGTISTNQDTAPDGTASADKLILTNGQTNTPQVNQDVSATNGLNYTLSIYAKKAEKNSIILLGGGSLSGAGVRVNLTTGLVTGTYTSATLVSSSVTPVANGYFRVAITVTATSTGTGSILIRACNDDGSAYAGNGVDGIYLWGAQVEANTSFPTSLIPTGASTATRTADVASVSTQAFPYSASEGTVVANVAFISGNVAADQMAVQLDNGSTSQRHKISRYSGGIYGTTTVTTAQADITLAAASTAGTVYRAAYAFKENDFAGSANGGTVATDTSGSMPTGITDMRLGKNWNAFDYLNGHIRQITYLPRRISNAELQSRTA